jgi:glyoxylase-like metal-dependent hydrolase (beta-lactamase superfamily II)
MAKEAARLAGDTVHRQLKERNMRRPGGCSVTARIAFVVAAVATAAFVTSTAPRAVQRDMPPLRLEEVGAETDAAFRVVSTIVVGPTECVLWDAQYKVSDGKRLADRIAATGKRLKAIVISHADHDHYMGAMEVLARFPNTPVYMAAATLADYNERSQQDLAAERKRPNAEAPEKLATAQLLPATSLTVDGHRLEVIEGLVGDVRKPASAVLWIPSLRAALVADLAFSGIHPWLGDSDIASRSAWRASLKRIADLKPAIVVPGHKADIAAPDSPDVLTFMQTYLTDFDRLMASSATPTELVSAMREKYSDLKIPGLMASGARNFKK